MPSCALPQYALPQHALPLVSPGPVPSASGDVLRVEALRELLPHRFSCMTVDLAILTWDDASIVVPS